MSERRCKARNRAGQPCGRAPILGAEVCYTHGGATPQVKAAAARRQAEKLAARDAAKAVQLFGGRRDISPAEALLELVQTKAAEVWYWRARVAEVDEDALTWGVTKVKSGGDDHGTTEEAKASVLYLQMRQAEQDLASYSAAALRAGVEQAMVNIAQQQAKQIITVLRIAVADPRLGVTADSDIRDTVIADALREVTA